MSSPRTGSPGAVVRAAVGTPRQESRGGPLTVSSVVPAGLNSSGQGYASQSSGGQSFRSIQSLGNDASRVTRQISPASVTRQISPLPGSLALGTSSSLAQLAQTRLARGASPERAIMATTTTTAQSSNAMPALMLQTVPSSNLSPPQASSSSLVSSASFSPRGNLARSASDNLLGLGIARAPPQTTAQLRSASPPSGTWKLKWVLDSVDES